MRYPIELIAVLVLASATGAACRMSGSVQAPAAGTEQQPKQTSMPLCTKRRWGPSAGRSQLRPPRPRHTWIRAFK